MFAYKVNLRIKIQFEDKRDVKFNSDKAEGKRNDSTK